MTSIDEANGWYGGTLLGDQDENSEIYKHYAALCQVIIFEASLIILRFHHSSVTKVKPTGFNERDVPYVILGK